MIKCKICKKKLDGKEDIRIFKVSGSWICAHCSDKISQMSSKTSDIDSSSKSNPVSDIKPKSEQLQDSVTESIPAAESSSTTEHDDIL